MELVRFREDTYPEEVTLLLGDNPLDLDTVQEVLFTYDQFGTKVSVLCEKQTPLNAGVILVPFEDEHVGVAGCFKFDIKSQDLQGSKITFVVGNIEFSDDVSK